MPILKANLVIRGLMTEDYAILQFLRAILDPIGAVSKPLANE